MDGIKQFGVDPEEICAAMTKTLTIFQELIYRCECDDRIEEIRLMREQMKCCLKTLAQFQNVTEIERYASGRVKPVCFCVSDTVRDLVTMAQQKIRYGMPAVEGDIDKGIVCVADPERFAACIMNLIVNGLQNVDREEGTVRVTVHRHFDYVSVSVIDNGYGMTQQQLQESLESEGTRGFDVLKKFCETVGTSPVFETTENGGFSVTVRLPLPKQENPDELEFNSDIRPSWLEAISPCSVMLYKIDEADVFL